MYSFHFFSNVVSLEEKKKKVCNFSVYKERAVAKTETDIAFHSLGLLRKKRERRETKQAIKATRRII